MDNDIKLKRTIDKTFPRSLMVVAIIMVLFGLAEVATGFTHNFIVVVTTSGNNLSTYLGVALGLFYFLGGLLVLSKRKWAALTALFLLSGDVIGRNAMVLTGLYPVDSLKQSFAIIMGTSIAVLFAIYIVLKIKYFK